MIVAASRQRGPDLFAWREAADARAALEAAEERRTQAESKLRHAPHGEIKNRRKDFEEATQEALRAARVLRCLPPELLH